MGYIGNQTSNSYSSMDKQTITGNGGASYTLTHAVANAQEIEVFVNNVRQEAGVAYTVSGTTLTMTGNVASTDDFYVIYQDKALQTTVPPDDSVTTARINDGAVTTAKLNANAVTEAKMFSGFANGIVMADQFRLTTAHTVSGGTLSSWERPTDANGNNMRFAQLGTGMTESSGIFSFPATGYYVLYVSAEIYAASGDSGAFLELQVTEDNSSYTTVSLVAGGSGSGIGRGTGSMINLMNITDTTNQKFLLKATSMASGSIIEGDADYNRTAITIVKIADSQ